MTKGEKLIWGLFEMVRELMPPTAQNAERFNQWAAAFHELEQHAAAPAAPRAPHEPPTRSTTITQFEPEPEDEDEVPADPHEHGVPDRPGGKRKKK